MVSQIGLAGFAEQEGSVFQVMLANDQTFDLILESVEEKEKANDAFESFSLFFQGQKNAFLPQNTYVLKHEELGLNEIFLVPIGEKETVFEYQAVFNLKKRSDD